MAVSKLTCPECATVLRPAKPLAPGKKVKCPRCDTVFAAGSDEPDDDEEKEEARPARKAPAKARAAKAAKKAAPKKKADEEEEGTYGFLKSQEEEEEEEERKPRIDYAPDMSIKDLRGPAVKILMSPSNKLTFVGFAGVFGWLVLLILILIPYVFPIKDEDVEQDARKVGPGLSQVSPWATTGSFTAMMGVGAPAADAVAPPPRSDPVGPNVKIEQERGSFYEVAGLDISQVSELEWYWFMVAILPIILLGCYSSLVAYGAIRMQNLESRRWGIAASILAMLPFNTIGLGLVLGMGVNGLVLLVGEDPSNVLPIGIAILAILYVISIAAGVYALMTLLNEDVKAGFEYVAD
jgi:hypothetical protein